MVFSRDFKDRIIFTDWDLPNILVLCNSCFVSTVCDRRLLILFLLCWIKNTFCACTSKKEFMNSQPTKQAALGTCSENLLSFSRQQTNMPTDKTRVMIDYFLCPPSKGESLNCWSDSWRESWMLVMSVEPPSAHVTGWLLMNFCRGTRAEILKMLFQREIKLKRAI